MTKFAVIIDNTAESIKGGFSQYLLEAKTLIDAMNEAEKFFADDTYMMEIAERVGKTTKNEEYGYKSTLYRTVLANRGYGWHSVDDKHGERVTTWEYQNWGKDKYWEIF